jgi:hypothetical protein
MFAAAIEKAASLSEALISRGRIAPPQRSGYSLGVTALKTVVVVVGEERWESSSGRSKLWA